MHHHSHSNQSLSQSCRDIGIKPEEFWDVMALYPQLGDDWARARDQHARVLAEGLSDIALDDSKDVLVQPDGRLTPNNASVRRAELRIATNQWMIERSTEQYRDKSRAGSPTVNVLAKDCDVSITLTDLDDLGPDQLDRAVRQ
jgi:hypothetical protein